MTKHFETHLYTFAVALTQGHAILPANLAGMRAKALMHGHTEAECSGIEANPQAYITDGRIVRSSRVTFHHFDNDQEARDYRRIHGTGGWIFVCSDNGEATLFPPHMTPSHIRYHPLVAGQIGRLLASA